MSEPLVYSVAELQEVLDVGRHTALRLAHEIGIRVSPRRLVVPRVRLEAWLKGGEGSEEHGNTTAPRRTEGRVN